MRRAAFVFLLAACGKPAADAPAPAAAASSEALQKTTDGGPVKATVSLTPAKPRLGDRLTLVLTVDAAAGVSVLLPAFGDALGRFSILEFVPGAPQRLADGSTRTVQRYTLESPLSGRQRIPALRLEVTDERQDAGPGTRELLTEELPLEVASVLADEKGARADLRPARARLPEELERTLLARLAPFLIGGSPLLVIALALAVRAARRRAAARARVNAFDVAVRRLGRLESRGFPRPEDADAWYVELSGIVRRYIEDRFAIRAPELTTEEFLHVARRSPELSEAHATLLTQFLASCDRVKFAGYKPDDKESAEVLASARRFLEETRLVEEPGRAPEEGRRVRAFLHVLELRQPWWLLLALLAVPVFFLGRRAAGRVRFSSLALLPRAASSWRARLSFLPELLVSMAVVALAIALAGPRVGDRKSRVQKSGIAMVLAVNISGSMRALDLSADKQERTRLDAVKEVFRRFVVGGDGLAGRPNDLIGVVSFARYADTRSPLTLDHESLDRAAAALELVQDRAEDGTALGDGLALAVERLRESTAASRVAILLTDGVQNAGDTEPLTAAELAQSVGVKVYTIGAGTNGFAPVRVDDPFTGRSVLQAVPVEIDEDVLKAIAEKTGGRYFRATDAQSLEHIYQEIDALERTKFEEERFREYHEYYAAATALGLLLCGLGWLAGGTVFRRLP